jgi:hypothetical protein
MVEAVDADCEVAFNAHVDCLIAREVCPIFDVDDDPETLRTKRRWYGLVAFLEVLTGVDYFDFDPHDPIPSDRTLLTLPARRRLHVVRPRARERRDAGKRGGCRAGPDSGSGRDDPERPRELRPESRPGLRWGTMCAYAKAIKTAGISGWAA